MKRIELTQGKFALVDDADYDYINQFTWHYNQGYAVRSKWIYATKKDKTVRMHRLIMSAPKGVQVDHIDNDGLNNQRSNLRLVTNLQNSHNQRSNGGSSIYKGVSWHQSNKNWNAYIKVDGKLKHLGSFTDEQEAARAYDAAARENFGVYAGLNFEND